MPPKKIKHLDVEEILAAEYDYIADTASQAHEDRARFASFYLIAVGSLVAALFSTQLLGPDFDAGGMNPLFSGLFFILTLLGITTIIQLARLRAAWHDSMMAMNQIKEYVISQNKDLEKAFRWRRNTLPPLYKPNSIYFWQAVEVAMLGGVMFGGSVFFFLRSFAYSCLICNAAYTGSFGLLAFVGQLYLYKKLLTNKK
jgi:hypothetical protein